MTYYRKDALSMGGHNWETRGTATRPKVGLVYQKGDIGPVVRTICREEISLAWDPRNSRRGMDAVICGEKSCVQG